jgi:hypothetical protein
MQNWRVSQKTGRPPSTNSRCSAFSGSSPGLFVKRILSEMAMLHQLPQSVSRAEPKLLLIAGLGVRCRPHWSNLEAPTQYSHYQNAVCRLR